MTLRRPTPAIVAALRAVAVWLLVVLSSATALGAEAQQQQAAGEAGQLSEASLTERIAAAYDIMQHGEFEDGYTKLRSALADAAKTDLYAFTVSSYSNAGATMYENQILDRAKEISGRRRHDPGNEGGRQGARRFLSQLCDRQARPRRLPRLDIDVRDGDRSVCPLLRQGIQPADVCQRHAGGHCRGGRPYRVGLEHRAAEPGDRRAGARTGRSLHLEGAEQSCRHAARDRCAVAGARLRSQRAVASAPATMVSNHFNVLVSANNTAQDYLDLGDYPSALRYFQQNRDIAVALKQEGNLGRRQADAWMLYTRLLAGAQPLDDGNIAQIERIGRRHRQLSRDTVHQDRLSAGRSFCRQRCRTQHEAAGAGLQHRRERNSPCGTR